MLLKMIDTWVMQVLYNRIMHFNNENYMFRFDGLHNLK